MKKKLPFSALFLLLAMVLLPKQSFGQGSGANPTLVMYRFNGSPTVSPLPVVQGNLLGTVKWNGLATYGDIRTGASIHSIITDPVAPGVLQANMIFRTSDNLVGLANRMIITEEGRVGIGLDNPAFNLHVIGNTHTTGDFFGRIHMDPSLGTPGAAPDTYLEEAYFEYKQGTDMVPTTGLTNLTNGGLLTLAPSNNTPGVRDHQLFFNAGGIFYRQESANNGTWTAAWEKLLTSGDIMGRPNLVAKFRPPDNPSSKLGDSQLFDNGSNVVVGGIPAGPDPTPVFNPADLLTVNGNARINGSLRATVNLTSDGSANVTGLTTTGSLNVATDATVNGISRLVGKVVVGANPISSPGSHSLYVGGSAIAEEVVVKLKAFWPDYVFEQDHGLQPLSEVEEFIQKEKHLPGVASAKEVAENGLNLGEMQKAQMEKIEELYLHMIDMNKQLKELQAENQMLKAKIEKLEQR